MTKRQTEYFLWIRQFIHNNNFPPSFHEIRIGMGIKSLASVHKKIGELAKRGALTYRPQEPRSIQIMEPPSGCDSCRRLMHELEVSNLAIEKLASVLRPVKISTNAQLTPSVSFDCPPLRAHSVR